jgi:TPR repeat protein
MQEIEVLAANAPTRAHAEIAELGRLVGGVPALHDAVEEGEPLFAVMLLKGQGTPQNVEQAFRLCREAAEYGLAESQLQLGDLYRVGMGRQRISSLRAPGTRKPRHEATRKPRRDFDYAANPKR